ncbi:MAG TPA: 1-acyl-sn-glycerol-3-phosphate acyltransferase, partial [Propionibacteriaceae bacterium]|nr:1-acyl-sn-glycerol-3-phosphate acyltransferase [Propionibacteriaceae bacterium]
MRRTGWARSAPARALRELVQVVGVKNVMRKELAVEVYGLDEFRQLDGPALIVANHASHLDTAVLLSTLPTRRRRHTAVAIEADYFFDSWWRASGSAIAFNT